MVEARKQILNPHTNDLIECRSYMYTQLQQCKQRLKQECDTVDIGPKAPSNIFYLNIISIFIFVYQNMSSFTQTNS